MAEVKIANPRTLTRLQEIRDAKPEMAFYSVHTCWWTTNADDLCCPDGHAMKDCEYSGVPLDPSGSPLFQTDDVEGFLASAEENAEHYGRHGIEAFILAYHGNMVSSEGYSRCTKGWDSYNDILDNTPTTEPSSKETE